MSKLKFHTKPWKHQIEALEYLMPRSYGALYTDMGSGKTKIMIDLIINRGWKRTIIVCPKKVCGVWPREFSKHAPTGLISVLDLSKISGNKRPAEIEKHVSKHKIAQQVIVINYEGIWREPLRKYFLEKFKADAVICDESHRIKSPASKCSRYLHLLGKRVKNRFLMTGTPLAQSPLDIYGQYRFLEPDIFGTNFNNFKNRYANWIITDGGFPILAKNNPYKNLDELQEKMFSCAFKVDVELNLPETVDITFNFDMSPEAQRYYKEIQKEGILELEEGYVDAGNILAVITRLQQITSGYVPITSENGDVEIVDIDDSRRQTLLELLESLPEEEPVVIFAKYKKDIKNIRKIVKSIGKTVSEVSGRVDELEEWMNGNTDVVVVQISSGSDGIDLTRARYQIYYTLGHSLSQYLQSRKRIHRPGQTRPVIYYTLVAKMKKGSTIDEKIINSLQNNKDVIDSIMEERGTAI